MSEEIVKEIEISEKKDKGLVSGQSKVKIQQQSIGVIFTISCLIGGALIALGVMFQSNFLSLVCPIILMLAYYWIAKNSKTGMPLSVIGDSYYYMGFIFTMFSLVVSLLSLSSSNGVNINSMVGSFGAALLTTIVGLLLRLATTSFSVQTKEKRKNLETEIERSLLTFSAQLETLTSEVSMSLTKVHSETQKVLIDSADGYRRVQEELADSFKVSMERDQKQISNSMQELSSKISSINITSDIISKPIELALSDLIGSLNEQNETYKTITKDVVKTNKSLSTQMSKSGSYIQEHMTNLDSGLTSTLQTQLASYDESIKKISTAIISSLDSFSDIKAEAEDQIQAQLVSYDTSINQISAAIVTSLGSFTDIKLEAEDQIQTQIARFSGSLKTISDDMSLVSEPITNSVQSFNHGIDKFKVNINTLTESSDIMNMTLANAVDNANELSGMKNNLEAFNSSVSVLNVQLAESVELNKATNKMFSDSSSLVGDSSKQILSDINKVYDDLATQIKGVREQ